MVGVMFMKGEILCVVIMALLLGCTSVGSSKDDKVEPDQFFIDIFDQYSRERRDISVLELQSALSAWLKSQSNEDRRRAELVYRNIDVSRVMHYLSKEAPTTASTYECLRHIECGAYAVATMKSWAMAQFAPICITRGENGQWVEMRYEGTSEDGMSACGDVAFVKEGDEWKISFQSFGGSACLQHNKLLQPTCEDARG
jgi:hypothetical protein